MSDQSPQVTYEWRQAQWSAVGNVAIRGLERYAVIWPAGSDPQYACPMSRLLPGIPRIGTAHPVVTAATVSEVRSSAGEGPLHYLVDVSYAWSRPDSGEGGEGEGVPWEHPARWSSDSAVENVPIDTDIDGKAITNSADESFDPPITDDQHDRAIRVVSNELTFSESEAWAYEGAVNADEWRGYPAGTVKCTKYSGQDEYWSDAATGSSTRYWIVTREFVIRRDGWKKRNLDQGFRTKDSEGKYSIVTDEDGSPLSSPVLLDGSGGKLVGTTAVWREFVTRESKSFNIFASLG